MTMRRVLHCGGLAAAVALMASCELLSGPGEGGRPAPMEALPRELSSAEREVIAGSNAFAFDILRETIAREEGPDVMLSPLSASMALGMTMNGARGPTFDGMRTTLGFAGLEQDAINQSYRDLIDLLLGLDDGVDMRIGNSVWARTAFPFHDAFMQTVEQSFDAEVSNLDFAAADAAPTINSWVDRSTNGRITEIVAAPIPDDVVMYLINAIYFKGDWVDQFDRRQTHDAPFTRADGSTKTVRMMSRAGGFRYFADADVEVAELRYGRGAFVMNIVVPRTGSIDEFIATLDETRWSALTDAVQPTGMHLRMPKFRMEYETTMNEPLIALGMQSAFGVTPDTDFTGLSPAGRDLYISNVKQKTFINVDEEGTEAAAVTSVEIGVVSMPPTMNVDRPFLVAIRERFSGTILFIGRVGDPAT
jgi:serpin B